MTNESFKQIAITLLMACAAFSPSMAAATVVFQQNFDNPADPLVPLVGTIANDAFTSVSGAATSGAGLPRQHDLSNGNQGRLMSDNFLSLNPTSPTALAGTTFSFDAHMFTSGTADRVHTFSAMENGAQLMSVGFDMQQNLLVNGSTAGEIVTQPNTAFRGLDWAKFTVTLNATDWNLDIQRYLPESGRYDGVGDIVAVTDASGSPTGISDSYTFPYLNSASTVTSFKLAGNANFVSFTPLGFYDNIAWDGTPIPEPAALALCGIGALGMVICGKRRRK